MTIGGVILPDSAKERPLRCGGGASSGAEVWQPQQCAASAPCYSGRIFLVWSLCCTSGWPLEVSAACVPAKVVGPAALCWVVGSLALPCPLTLPACVLDLLVCSGTVVRVGPGKMAEDGQRKAPKVRSELGGARGGGLPLAARRQRVPGSPAAVMGLLQARDCAAGARGMPGRAWGCPHRRCALCWLPPDPGPPAAAAQVKEGDRVIYFKYAGAWTPCAHVFACASAAGAPAVAAVVQQQPGPSGAAQPARRFPPPLLLSPAGDSMETPSGEKYNVLHESDILAKI